MQTTRTIRISATIYCHLGAIDGLPANRKHFGNVYVVETETNSGDQLTLSCRCSIFTPFWEVYDVETQMLSGLITNNIECRNNATGVECEQKYLSSKMTDVFLTNTETFSMSQPKMLMCFSGSVRHIVIINVSLPLTGDEACSFCFDTRTWRFIVVLIIIIADDFESVEQIVPISTSFTTTTAMPSSSTESTSQTIAPTTASVSTTSNSKRITSTTTQTSKHTITTTVYTFCSSNAISSADPTPSTNLIDSTISDSG